jgi:glutamate carboxypeptidase
MRFEPNFENRTCAAAAPLLRAERLLEELVNIDSTTTNIDGVKRVLNIVVRELESLGFAVRYIENPHRDLSTAPLLLGELAGQSDHFITFVSHADTVLSPDPLASYTKRNAEIAIGSGVIDNKGGLVIALEGVKRFLKSCGASLPHFGLRFICSPNEETGSTGFHDLFRSFAQDSEVVLGFEPALDDGSIIESRRGNRWYQIHVQGEEAHAGRCKGEEINAAHDLALKIAKLYLLNDASEGVSVNVAQIEAGRDRFNVVCGEASAKIDTRFASFASRDRLHGDIERILLTPEISSSVTGRKSNTKFTIEDDCPPFSESTLSKKLISSYTDFVSKIEGRTVSARKAGGAGDVNHMSRPGLVVIDGLGAVGGNMHTSQEFISLPSLTTRALALASFLEETRSVFSNRVSLSLS